MTKRTLKLILAGFCGCLLIAIIAITIAVTAGAYFGVRWWRSIPRVSDAETYIAKYVPKSAELLESRDDHGGIHGDGTLWRKYRLAGTAKQTFETTIGTDKGWKPLPLPDELKRLSNSFGFIIAVETTAGYYFFYDFQPEWYPDSGELTKPVSDRASFNFILMIYDPKTGLLYIDNEDT